MDSFWRRLKYYGFGFLGGLVFVFVFFQNRGCSWLPANRVKNTILDRVIVISDDQKNLLLKKGFSIADVKNALNEGEVNFSESRKKGELKVYEVTNEIANRGEVTFYFTLPNESFISEVRLGPLDVNKVQNSTKGTGTILHFPKDEHLVFIDSTDLLLCQKRQLSIKKSSEILRQLKSNGKIHFSLTDFKSRPKVNHRMSFLHPKTRGEIYFDAVWYKNKIDVVRFITDSTMTCP
jgi:hypothetical protein